MVVLLVYIFVNDCKQRIVLLVEVSCYLWPSDTQELSFYSQNAVLVAFSVHAIGTNTATIFWIGRAPLSHFSGSLLIFHNLFFMFPARFTQDEYLQLSDKSNIYENHTRHWKKKYMEGLLFCFQTWGLLFLKLSLCFCLTLLVSLTSKWVVKPKQTWKKAVNYAAII